MYIPYFFVLLMFFWFLEDVSIRAPDVWHLLRNCEHIYFVAGTYTIGSKLVRSFFPSVLIESGLDSSVTSTCLEVMVNGLCKFGGRFLHYSSTYLSRYSVHNLEPKSYLAEQIQTDYLAS